MPPLIAGGGLRSKTEKMPPLIAGGVTKGDGGVI